MILINKMEIKREPLSARMAPADDVAANGTGVSRSVGAAALAHRDR